MYGGTRTFLGSSETEKKSRKKERVFRFKYFELKMSGIRIEEKLLK